MTDRWFDEVARRLAGRGATRRALARLAFGAAVAGQALGDATEVAAACRAPKKPCEKGRQCCTGRCKQGKCAKCSNGAVFLRAPDLLCWLEWGSNGAGSGEFAFPQGVAVGGNGHVYVADTSNHRIQEFDGDVDPPAFVRQWGSHGAINEQFALPSRLATGANGHVYVADTDNHRIQEFTATGGFVRAWGGPGVGPGQFNTPAGVAVAANGHVYVTEAQNQRVQEFDATGGFVRGWGTTGAGAGQLRGPSGVAVRGKDLVYVADSSNHRIVRAQRP